VILAIESEVNRDDIAAPNAGLSLARQTFKRIGMA
jgi:hypothetical protein